MSNNDFDFMSQEDFNIAITQSKIVATALAFLKHVYTGDDLSACWNLLDPTLKLSWAQAWLVENSTELEAEGYDLTSTAKNLIEQSNQHDLWEDFQQGLLQSLREQFPLEIDKIGIGSTPRSLELDVELLYIHASAPEGGYWKPNESSSVIPIVLRLVDSEWKILNFGFGIIPVPGWPPQLG